MKNLPCNDDRFPDAALTVRQRLADHFTASTFTAEPVLSAQLGLPLFTFRESLREELGRQFTLSMVREEKESAIISFGRSR